MSQMFCQKWYHFENQVTFDVDIEKGLKLIEISEGVSIEDIRSLTGCTFEVIHYIIIIL